MCILGFCNVSTLEAPRFSENLECDMNKPTMIRMAGPTAAPVGFRCLSGAEKCLKGWKLDTARSSPCAGVANRAFVSWHCFVLAAMFYVASLPSWSAGQNNVPADRAPDMVPFGVYLSWERTGACARHYGIDRWEDVHKRLDAIATNYVDTLWVTNMAEADLPRLITECEKRGIRLIPSLSTIEGKVEWRWHNEDVQLEETDSAGGSRLGRLTLAAGEGTILAIERKDEKAN